MKKSKDLQKSLGRGYFGFISLSNFTRVISIIIHRTNAQSSVPYLVNWHQISVSSFSGVPIIIVFQIV